MTIALDLFAGHGWGVACRELGIEEYGVEIMPEACAVREANGMRTIYNDVWDGLVGTEGASAETYASPFRDGRAIASFTIDKPGTYNVFAFSSGPSKSAGAAGTFALAPEGRPGWIGGMTGLIPLVLVPAVLAVAAFVAAHWLRVRREPTSAPIDLP